MQQRPSILFADRQERLWLFFVMMYGESWFTCKIKYTTSEDCSESWSDVKVLRDELGWMVRTKPLYVFVHVVRSIS